jgi:diketogulonate reductase-like aldo/keto reductase
MGYEQAKASINSSFAQTELDYIDLQALHPSCNPHGTRQKI